MRRRLLNIASIVCLVACVALVGLWVRSYRYHDTVGLCRQGLWGVAFFTWRGTAACCAGPGPVAPPTPAWLWDCRSEVIHPGSTRVYEEPAILNCMGFRVHYLPKNRYAHVIVPFAYLVPLGVVLAMLFQLRWPWRFTLRHVFVLTTFLALVLGMIAWLNPAWLRE